MATLADEESKICVVQYVSWTTLCDELKINGGGGGDGRCWIELEKSTKNYAKWVQVNHTTG